MESVARCSWNGWPDGRGIRNLARQALLGGFGVFVGIAKGIFQADVQTDLLSGQGAITPALGGLTHLELGFV